MRRLFESLPGPRPIKALLMACLIVAALVLLVVVFELLGTFLDSGGAMIS